MQFSIIASLHYVSAGFVMYFILWRDSNIAMKLGIFSIVLKQKANQM